MIVSPIKEWYAKNRDRFQDRASAVAACVKELKMDRRSVMKWIKGPSSVLVGGGHVLTESDLKQKHDPYFQIAQAAKTLKEGEFVADADFRDHVVKISTAAFRRPSDNPEFSKYRGKAGSSIYWGHPKSIEKLKEEGVLQ